LRRALWRLLAFFWPRGIVCGMAWPVRLAAYEEIIDSLFDEPASKASADKARAILKELWDIEAPKQFDGDINYLSDKAKLVVKKWYGHVDAARLP
jgi:hypothetical protein